MSMLGSYRRVLLLCCSVTAIAGLSSTTNSAALAGHDAGGVPVVNVADSVLANVDPRGVADELVQLRSLADLQRRQIALQRQALGRSSSIEMLRVEHEPLPADVLTLNALIDAQQRTIEAQGHELTARSKGAATEAIVTAEASMADRTSETVIESKFELVDNSLVSTEWDEELILPANLVEQGMSAREQFDLALAAARSESSESGATVDRADMMVEPSSHVEPVLTGGDAIVVSENTALATPVRSHESIKLDAQLPRLHDFREPGQRQHSADSLIAETGLALYRAPEPDSTMRMDGHFPQTMAHQFAAHEAQAADETVVAVVGQSSASNEMVETMAWKASVETVVQRSQQSDRGERLTHMAQAYYGSNTVPDQELDEIRAGFVTSNGLIVNIGVVFETLINGELVAQNVVNFDDLLASGINPGDFNTVVAGVDGTTEIINTVGGGGGISTVIANSSSDIAIEQINTLTISIPNHSQLFDQVGGGHIFTRGLQLPQAFIDMSVGAIGQ